MPRIRIAASYGSSLFRFLRNLHTVPHNGCMNLHSHQHVGGFPFSISSLAFTVCKFFDDDHSYSEVIPHCSFDLNFCNSDAEHCLLCFLIIYIFLCLKKCTFRSFTHFFDWVIFFFFLMLSCMSCLYIYTMDKK